jgi:DNA polymerase elongation subunit (family B)
MYKKIFARKIEDNKHLIHLWTDTGYEKVEWTNFAYKECPEGKGDCIGLNGESLRRTSKWRPDDSGLHFSDMKTHQKFLIEKYGTNDEVSTTHKELFFDIETEMGDALTVEYIQSAPKKVTSIAWYDKQVDEWGILILDTKNQLKHTKAKNKEITPCKSESELLAKFLEKFREIDPDILVGYNSDYFDIPYLYYRMCNVLGEDWARHLSPIGYVRETPWFKDQYVQICGVESLDYMRLHKKFSWRDEPSWKLDVIGEKYAGINKVEYEGNLDSLFETDIHKFIEYNFVDVKILVELDKKLEYLALTKNLSHKGKHNYSEVYANTNTQDGAISAYLLSKNIIPPSKEKNQQNKKGYAGGYLFCPKAGVYNYMFDEDLTSLYPSIIMSLNIGKETFKGRIIDADDRNNRLGLSDLKSKDPNNIVIIKNHKGKSAEVTIANLIKFIKSNNFTISANGTMFATHKQSVLSTILAKWFDERVFYKDKMKKAYKAKDNEAGAKYHLLQYTMKILLNSLYGATALPSFRYGMNHSILSEAITLSGHRIIQESALVANREMNKEIKTGVKPNRKIKKSSTSSLPLDPKIERNISPRPYGI